MGNILSAISIKRWTYIGLLNLAIVAGLGLLMRIKVIFPFPFLDQKYIMHAHSHFAFSGWLSHMLMVLMAMVVLQKKSSDSFPPRYHFLFGANLIASYGMLFCFSWQGYGLYSIICSTLTILLSYLFVGIMWRSITISTLSPLVRNWFRAALVFLVISSVGTYYLAYLQALGNVDTRKQLSAVYFFLHFQYNGWFFFACMGLMNHWLVSHQILLPGAKLLYRVFAWACIPAYLLSVLWMNLPTWLYAVLVFVVICQNLSWFYWLVGIYRYLDPINKIIITWIRPLLVLVLLAASIKIMLQGISVIPVLSNLAYSFRPIVVGYLHLVLLGVITLSILAFIFMTKIIDATYLIKGSISLLVIGIILNELLLMLQGVSGMLGKYIPYTSQGLAMAALVMFTALLSLLVAVCYSGPKKGIKFMGSNSLDK